MVQFVLVLDPSQDRNRILDARLFDINWLEPALERRVFLDIFLIFIERGRTDAMQFAARQCRFQQIAASIDPSDAPAPISVCISSMNRMI